jgi:organic hydroperoxide reductase OsmC/OhrA
MKKHAYEFTVNWTGNLGQGTARYNAYSRNHEILIPNKPVLLGSSDAAFRGDTTRYTPEEMLVASLSTCHMLWYLHLCAEAGICVTSYSDKPRGVMAEMPDGAGHFEEVLLRPETTIRAGDDEKLAHELHQKAHELCFIARSVNFPVRCEARIRTQS